MSDTLFKVFTVHCCWCKHITRDASSLAASDAMERHYWDAHYNQEDRDHLRAAGQPSKRMGVKP